MTTSTTSRIIYTALVSIAIVTTSLVYRYIPEDLELVMKRRHDIIRMRITIVNHNEIESRQWIELRCKGFQDFDNTAVWWSGMALVHPGKSHNFTLPTISVTDVIHVYCKYKGSDGCMADGVELFKSPGTDNFYCAEDVGRCALVFKESGLVDKEYVGAFSHTIGNVPNSDPVRKCLWIDCLLQKDQIIGKKHCCGSKCEAW
ncbi:hypothetical protein LUZ60_006323 [Juncus effusus]|nr:hypothetical protein LUZ60_006323 [Juncus effusus]